MKILYELFLEFKDPFPMLMGCRFNAKKRQINKSTRQQYPKMTVPMPDQ